MNSDGCGNDEGCVVEGGGKETVGVIFKNVLNAT